MDNIDFNDFINKVLDNNKIVNVVVEDKRHINASIYSLKLESGDILYLSVVFYFNPLWGYKLSRALVLINSEDYFPINEKTAKRMLKIIDDFLDKKRNEKKASLIEKYSKILLKKEK